MKHFILFIILLTSLNCFAQVPNGWWFAAGGNMSSLNSEQLKSDGVLGYSFGIGMTTGYHERYHFEFNLIASTNNFDLYKSDFEGNDIGTVKASRSSADFSFNYNYYIILPEENKFYLGVRPGLDVVYHGKFKLKDDDDGYSYSVQPLAITPSSISNSSGKFNLDPSLGISAGYNNFRFILKYNLGLGNYLNDLKTDSFDNSNLYTGPEIEGKLNRISLIVFYRFYIKKQ
tara:strand:- start:15482 stop:16171 length:690 start_codon:yes stop_codon:yes gene_type:complete